MKIRELIRRLEKIEKRLDKEETALECELVSELIDNLIEDDINFEKFMLETSKKTENELLEELMAIGMENGLVGKA
jgi:hypothetical protein|tara:strand:+ start:28 stop:255 length:228 start_codon:yes stop_codon:yes gene_type:complete